MSRPNTPETELRYITRMPDNLWRVWITYGKKDFEQIYFSDKKYSGKKKALDAAILYRDRVLAEHKIPVRIYTGNGFCVKHKNNKSGEIGITLDVDDRGNPTRVRWTTRNMVNGKQRTFARSIRKYGYIGSWQLVAGIRRAHTKMDVAETPPSPPGWLKRWAKKYNVNLSV